MRNKTEQINLRITSDIKDKLSEISNKKGLSMSDFIRQNLEKTISNNDSLNDRIASLETNFGKSHQKFIKRMMHAAATIASVDTGYPLEHCITITLQIFEKFDLKNINFSQMSRNEMEKNYITMQELIKEELKLSDMAISYISLLTLSFSAFIYDENIFDMSPLSILGLERIRKELV